MPYDGPQPISGMYVLADKPVVACEALHAAQNRRERNSREFHENWENTLGNIDRERYGVEGGKMNRHSIRGGIRQNMKPRRPSFNPSKYYGGNSETKEDLEKGKNSVQAGGKRKKSKKSRRSVDYGSMMLYGGFKKN